MILVKTKLKKSKVHGIGLFADQFIKKGTITWDYKPWFHISYTKKDISRMSSPARKQVLWYAYFDKISNRYILPVDDLRFINHSNVQKKVNIVSVSPYRDVALRNIRKGEEMLCDYGKFELGYFKRLQIDRKKWR